MHNICKCNSLDNSTKQSKKGKKKVAKSLHEIREPFVGKAFFLDKSWKLKVELRSNVQGPNNGAFPDITSKEKIISMVENLSNKLVVTCACKARHGNWNSKSSSYFAPRSILAKPKHELDLTNGHYLM
jgi:hypothetical protein